MQLIKEIENWVRQLEEATECDADYGDPNLCLEEVDLISKKMRKVAMDYRIESANQEITNGE